MDRFELTEEQKEQARLAREAGQRRVHIVQTPEQREYTQRIRAIADAEREEVQMKYLAAKVRKLEAALTAILDGKNDDARDLLESKS